MTGEPELKVLMLKSLDGDAASYRTLLDLLSRRLRAYYKGKLTRTGRSAAEAEDLVQEALLAVHLKRHTYDAAELLTPWLHAVARYKLIDYLRRTRSAIHVQSDEGDEVMAHDDHLDAESSYDVRRLAAQSNCTPKLSCSDPGNTGPPTELGRAVAHFVRSSGAQQEVAASLARAPWTGGHGTEP